jgi:hypothetical protein
MSCDLAGDFSNSYTSIFGFACQTYGDLLNPIQYKLGTFRLNRLIHTTVSPHFETITSNPQSKVDKISKIMLPENRSYRWLPDYD